MDEYDKKGLVLDCDTAPLAFEEATLIADDVGTGALVHRRSIGRQSTRYNEPAAISKYFFAVNYFISFFDYIIMIFRLS